MSRIRILLCALLACSALACGTVGASQAQASTSQKLYFEAPADLLNPSTRPHALVQLQALGVRALRVELNWYSVAPDPTSATKPSFEAKNPGSYAWGQYDDSARGSQATGLASAADCHLTRAEVGDLEPQSPIYDAPGR